MLGGAQNVEDALLAIITNYNKQEGGIHAPHDHTLNPLKLPCTFSLDFCSFAILLKV